jgi:hypothetical protein
MPKSVRALRAHLVLVAAHLHYKGFPTFVKQKSIVVNRAAIDHEIRLLFFPNITA